MQSKSLPATEGKNADASSAKAAICQICGKTEKEAEFSNSQKKRHKQGKTATCTLCADQKKRENVIPSRTGNLTKRENKLEIVIPLDVKRGKSEQTR